MAQIGSFKQTDKGYEGTIATLHLSSKVKFVPNENKKSEDSPDYFIKSGPSDFGVAWKETKASDEPLDYLSGKLDCPTLTKPINAALFDREGGGGSCLLSDKTEKGQRSFKFRKVRAMARIKNLTQKCKDIRNVSD